MCSPCGRRWHTLDNRPPYDHVDHSLSHGTVRADHVGGALRKARIALSGGRLPLSPRRWLQLFRLHVSEEAQREAMQSFPELPSGRWPATAKARRAAPAEAALELTVVGHVSEGTGVAAGAQASAAACRAAGISCELIDALPLDPMRGKYCVSLLHVNADQTPVVARALGEKFFRDRYTIGMWAWELEEFPDVFLKAFDWVDEVWAMSRFVQESVAEKSPVPVVHMPLSVTAKPTAGLLRRGLGIPEDRFLFLMMYDALSIQERKNPLGALEAFRRAFRDRSRVGMVIKVNHAASRPEDVALVRRQVADTEGALLIDRPMSREDAQALQASCDAFVSLHRSEGFGLNIAEAMLLGKPVVATGYSGNLDFTTSQNTCLVDYELVTLTQDYGPYQKGNRWAEPNIDHASDFMVKLVEDGVFRQEIAARGRKTIANDFSTHAIGRRYQRRLTAIPQRRDR